MTALAPTIEAFFTQRLAVQRDASPHTVAALTRWLSEHDCGPTDPVFPTRRGRPLSTDAVAWLLTKHAATAARRCPSLKDKHLTPHVLRHTAAMQLLHSGVDISVIAL